MSTLRVSVLREKQAPEVHSFAGPDVIVGRDGVEGVDLKLRTEDGASRRHCRISAEDGRIFVEDLRSRHGTLLRDIPLVGRREVTAQDTILVGYVSLRIEPIDAQPSVRAEPVNVPVARATLGTQEIGSDFAERCLGEVGPQALRWQELDSPDPLLLRGEALRRALIWLSGKERPRPDDLQQEFILRSGSSRRFARRRVGLFVGLVAASLIAGGATGHVLSRDLELAPTGKPRARQCTDEARAAAAAMLAANDGEIDIIRKLHRATRAFAIADRGGCARESEAEASLRALLAQRNVQVLGYHAGAIRMVAVAADGGRIATSDGRSIRLWDPSGRMSFVPVGDDRAGVAAIAMTGDGHTLAVAGDAGLVIWDVQGSTPVMTRTIDASPRSGPLALSPDGSKLATADDASIELWTLAKTTADSVRLRHGKRVAELGFAGNSRLHAFGGGALSVWGLHKSSPVPIPLATSKSLTAFAVGPNVIATGDDAGNIAVWQIKGNKATPRGGPWSHGDGGAVRPRVVAVAVVPGSEVVVSAASDRSVLVFGKGAVANGLVGLKADPVGLVVDAAVPRAVCIGADGAMVGWDLRGGDLVRGLDPQPTFVLNELPEAVLSIHPAGRWLVTGGTDGGVRVWDIQSRRANGGAHVLGDHRGVLTGDRHEAPQVAIDARGERLASGGEDGAIRLWQLDPTLPPTARVTERMGAGIDALTMTRDGRWLAGGGATLGLRLWRIDDDNGGRLTPVEVRDAPQTARRAMFSPDGRWLVSAGDAEVSTWRLAELEDPRPNPRIPTGRLLKLSVSDKGIAALMERGTLSVWELGGASARAVPGGEGAYVHAMAFDAGGGRLLVGQDARVRMWRLGDDGAVVPDPAFSLPLSHGAAVRAVAFGTGSFAAGGDDGKIRVWSLAAAQGADPIVLDGHTKEITDLVFSADGASVLSASKDGTVKLWAVASLGAPPVTLAGHSDEVVRVVPTSAFSRVVSASKDGTIRVWPLQPEELKAMACRALGRMPDGTSDLCPGL